MHATDYQPYAVVRAKTKATDRIYYTYCTQKSIPTTNFSFYLQAVACPLFFYTPLL